MVRQKKGLPVSRDGLLRGLIAGALAVSLILWGIPSLLAPAALLDLLGVPIPADPFAWLFVRLFGVFCLAGAYLYWHAYRDPVRNTAILHWAVLQNGLMAAALVAVGFIQGIIANPLVWVSAALAAAFCVGFALLLPRERMRVERRPDPKPQAKRRMRTR